MYRDGQISYENFYDTKFKQNMRMFQPSYPDTTTLKFRLKFMLKISN